MRFSCTCRHFTGLFFLRQISRLFSGQVNDVLAIGPPHRRWRARCTRALATPIACTRRVFVAFVALSFESRCLRQSSTGLVVFAYRDLPRDNCNCKSMHKSGTLLCKTLISTHVTVTVCAVVPCVRVFGHLFYVQKHVTVGASMHKSVTFVCKTLITRNCIWRYLAVLRLFLVVCLLFACRVRHCACRFATTMFTCLRISCSDTVVCPFYAQVLVFSSFSRQN